MAENERVLSIVSEEAEQATPLLQGTMNTNKGYTGEAPTYSIQHKPSNSSHKHHSKKKTICLAIICTVLIIFLTVFLTSTSLTVYYSWLFTNTSRDLRDEYLGIASDVIQCARNMHQHIISTVTIKENNSDYLNDNPKGIPLSVFSLHPNDIIYHYYEDPHTDFELVLSHTGDNKFIIPYNYYNRPWYMWPGSTINITLNINSSDPPKEALAYLIKGDTVINKFFETKGKPSKFEKMVDLMILESNNIFWTVEGNDYYYVAFYINADVDTIFKANISFVFKYIDIDDYSWLSNSDEHINKIGDSVKFDWFRHNITLCYLHPLDPSSLESDSIHIEASYAIEKPSFIIIASVSSSVILLIMFILLVTCCVLFQRRYCINSKHVS